VIIFALWDAAVPRSSQSASYAFNGGLISFVLLFAIANISYPSFARTSEKDTRDRLRSAEQKLVTRDDQLTLAALWGVTQIRLELYHQIATKQAKRSFLAAQVASVLGFCVLVGLAVTATRVHSTVGAITAGALGGVSAALAGYIGRTFVRSQESAASHLRAYFDQPLEFSRYLAAERLLVGLTDEQRASVIASLARDVLVPNANSESAKEDQGNG
jgi:hypothetical protein